MKENKLKDNVVKIKTYIVEMPKKKKITIGAIIGGVILLAIIIAIVLNLGHSDTYRVLYANTTADESNDVYNELQTMGIPATRNEQGQVMVPKEQYDTVLLQLAEKGYPNKGMTYDLFSSHSGMTATESDKQQWLIYQLQDDIQTTLKRLDGVNNATVIIAMPETKDYVWQQAENTETPTASVLLSFSGNATLGEAQVSAIKKLVSSAVPQMEPTDVTVVDAGTNLELFGEDDYSGSFSSSKNFEFEQQVQNQIESNIIRLLMPRYGRDGVVAVAKVTINYDQMMTERKELMERADGGGYVTHNEKDYSVNGQQTAGGLVGEEDNTDIPQQAYTAPGEDGGVTDYHSSTDYDYGYIKTQIEKGNAALERATVSVMVKEVNLTEARREELVNLISKSADIDPDEIYVSPFTPETASDDDNTRPAQSRWNWASIPLWVYITCAGILLLIIALVVVLILLRKRQKKRAKQQELEMEEQRKNIEDEITRYKQQLSDAAMASTDPKNDAILDEVRTFAKDNPEITASLLRSWLKEEGD